MSGGFDTEPLKLAAFWLDGQRYVGVNDAKMDDSSCKTFFPKQSIEAAVLVISDQAASPPNFVHSLASWIQKKGFLTSLQMQAFQKGKGKHKPCLEVMEPFLVDKHFNMAVLYAQTNTYPKKWWKIKGLEPPTLLGAPSYVVFDEMPLISYEEAIVSAKKSLGDIIQNTPTILGGTVKNKGTLKEVMHQANDYLNEHPAMSAVQAAEDLEGLKDVFLEAGGELKDWYDAINTKLGTKGKEISHEIPPFKTKLSGVKITFDPSEVKYGTKNITPPDMNYDYVSEPHQIVGPEVDVIFRVTSIGPTALDGTLLMSVDGVSSPVSVLASVLKCEDPKNHLYSLPMAAAKFWQIKPYVGAF